MGKHVKAPTPRLTETKALRLLSSAAVNGDYLDDATIDAIERALAKPTKVGAR